MLRLLKLRLLPVLLLACGLTACDDETPTAPTRPDPVTTPFSGTVTPNGAATHTLMTSTGGLVTATLTKLEGPEGQVIGFSLGNVIGSACSVVLANDNATAGAVLSGTLSGTTNLCVRMYDAGTLPGGTAVSYTVEVVHP